MCKSKIFATLIGTLILSAGIGSPSAQAQTISFSGTVVNLCVLTISTPGLLSVESSGMELATAHTGGVAASLSIVATGTNPTITFSTPTLTGPSSSGATTQLSYASPGGASRGYDGSGYVYAMNRLLDTVTINGRASNPSGFRSGVYSITSTATCSQ